MGVTQGCVAAPDLFNCATDFLMPSMFEKVQGVQLGNYHLTDLVYADHTILFAEFPANPESAPHIYNDETTKLGLRVNWVKTKPMHVGEGYDPPPL